MQAQHMARPVGRGESEPGARAASTPRGLPAPTARLAGTEENPARAGRALAEPSGRRPRARHCPAWLLLHQRFLLIFIQNDERPRGQSAGFCACKRVFTTAVTSWESQPPASKKRSGRPNGEAATDGSTSRRGAPPRWVHRWPRVPVATAVG